MANKEQRKAIFNDVWMAYKKYETPVDTDEYWNGLITDLNAVGAKHNNDKLARDFIMILIADIEREVKGKRRLIERGD